VYPVRTPNTYPQAPQPHVFGSPTERMERAAQMALNKLLNNSSSSGTVYPNNPGSVTVPYNNQQQYQQRHDEGPMQPGGWN